MAGADPATGMRCCPDHDGHPAGRILGPVIAIRRSMGEDRRRLAARQCASAG